MCGLFHSIERSIMSVQLPNGATIEIAASYGTAKTVSAVANTNPAVATIESGHSVAAGDYIEVTSGWSKLTNKIVRALTSSSDELAFEGIDATDTARYPASGGAGTVREILTWTQLLQVLTSTSSGGEQQFLQYQFLEDDDQKQIPTFKNASSLTLSIADDPTLAGYILAATANDDRLQRAIRITLPSGSVLLYNCYVSLNKTPTLTVNELMACQVTLSQLAEVTRYAD
jgi:hypothetical protein